MTSYTFLASSKKIQLPDEIVADHDARILHEPNKSFHVRELDEAEQWYKQMLRPIITLLICILILAALAMIFF